METEISVVEIEDETIVKAELMIVEAGVKIVVRTAVLVGIQYSG